LSPAEAVFVYMALLHQESLDHIKRAIAGFEDLSIHAYPKHSKIIQSFVKPALKHLEAIELYHRYPHRNEVLGRVSTPAEIDFMQTHSNDLYVKSQKPISSLGTESKNQNQSENQIKSQNQTKIKVNVSRYYVYMVGVKMARYSKREPSE